MRGRREAWLGQFTRAHREARIDVLDRLELDRRETMFTVRVAPGRTNGWQRVMSSSEGVIAVETLHASAAEELLRVYAEGPTYVPLLRTFGLVRQFPFPVVNGVAHWTVVGPSTKVRALTAHLRQDQEAAEIEGVRPYSHVDPPSFLTKRQREVLGWAVQSGYFDVPRRISLTRLAVQVGVATSTLSITLAVIERKFIQSNLAHTWSDDIGRPPKTRGEVRERSGVRTQGGVDPPRATTRESHRRSQDVSVRNAMEPQRSRVR